MAMTGAERLRREGFRVGIHIGRLEILKDLYERGHLSREVYESESRPLELELADLQRSRSQLED